MAVKPVKVGVIGCGNISTKYMTRAKVWESIEMVACADRIPERAQRRAQEFGLRACKDNWELLSDPEIEIVLNITNPVEHYPVAMEVLEAGKHLYGEKPMAINLENGKEILAKAKEKNLRIGGAPDTFLGGGLQTCRKLIDDGAIGMPVGFTANMLCPGHESWHPDPEFFYQVGGGPMLDMGPYYLTALINMLGPMERVAGATRVTHVERTIGSEAKRGQKITVEVPTHVVGLIQAEAGPIGTITTSFDVPAAFGKGESASEAAQIPFVEIYGSKGTIRLPDPNMFCGPVYLIKPDGKGPQEVPLTHGYAEENRSIGLADMAYALRSGRPHRANGEMTLHALEIMHAIHSSSDQGHYVELETSCERPAPLPAGLEEGKLDE